MSWLSFTLLWCSIQVTVIALLTAVISARPWRIGGASTPFYGLIAIFATSLACLMPTPHWFTPKTLANFVTVSQPTQDGEPRNSTERQAISRLDAAKQDAIATPALETKASLLSDFKEAFWDELQQRPQGNDGVVHRNMISTVVVSLFVVGILFGVARFYLGWIGVQALKRESTRIDDKRLDELVSVLRAELRILTPIDFYESPTLSTAATLGAFRPVILLPKHWKTWSQVELQAVLAHELAHVAHRDFAAQVLSQLGVVLHFYNPIIHWLAGRLRLEQELAADAKAAQIAGGNRKYVQLLAKLALDSEYQNVGWPARAFLPTRQTFLRRLEMLRNSKANPASRFSIGRWAAIAMIAIGTIAVLGFKPTELSSTVDAATPVAYSPIDPVPFELTYVGEDSDIIIALRPGEALQNKQLKQIAELIVQNPEVSRLSEKLGIGIADVEQVILGASVGGPAGGHAPLLGAAPVQNFLFLKSVKPFTNLESAIKGTPSKIGDRKVIDLDSSLTAWQPDDRTLVINSKRNIQRFIEGRKVESRLFESPVWNELKSEQVVAVVHGEMLRSMLAGVRNTPSPYTTLIPVLAPIIDEAKSIGVSTNVGKRFEFKTLVQCSDEKGATMVHETATAGLVLLKNGLRELERGIQSQAVPQASFAREQMQTFQEIMNVAGKLLSAAEVKKSGAIVNLTTGIDTSEIPMEQIAAAVTSARKAAQRMASANNMRQIGLAFHNFESAYRTFPNTKNTKDASGKNPTLHPYSWRVAILPFIEQNELYQQYHFDEPWDSEHNLTLLPKMPNIYRHTSDPANSTTTSYVVLTGPDAFFGNSEPTKLANIHDGTSNTILAVETKTSIPWTKPEDFEYSKTGALPKFGGFSSEGFQALFCDGSVRFLASSVDEKLLRAFITPRGGEQVSGE